MPRPTTRKEMLDRLKDSVANGKIMHFFENDVATSALSVDRS